MMCSILEMICMQRVQGTAPSLRVFSPQNKGISHRYFLFVNKGPCGSHLDAWPNLGHDLDVSLIVGLYSSCANMSGFDKTKVYILDGDLSSSIARTMGFVNPASDPSWPTSALKV